jgi:hypothetical protein
MPVFAVTTAKGANWDRAREIRGQFFWDEHAAFADRLVGSGVIIFEGPSLWLDGRPRSVSA